MEHEAVAESKENRGQGVGRHLDKVSGVNRGFNQTGQAYPPLSHRLQETGA